MKGIVGILSLEIHIVFTLRTRQNKTEQNRQLRQYHIQQIHFLFYFVLLIKLIMFVITQSFPLIVFANMMNKCTLTHIPDEDYGNIKME